MEIILDTSKPYALNWAAKGIERIAQNVFNLFNIWRYEVAYDRTKGLDTAILDMPAKKASAKFIAELYRIVPLYEPRAKVKSVSYLGVDRDGNIQHRVVIEV